MNPSPPQAGPSKKLQSWRTLFAQMGALDGLLYAASRAVDKIGCGRVRLIRYHLVAQPVPGAARGTLGPDPNAPVAVATRDSPLVTHFPRPAAVIQRRYESGALCFAAEVRGNFAGFLWLRRNGYEEDEVRCTYVLDEPQRSAWDFDVYVEPSCRLGRTMARLWQAADLHLTAQGVQSNFSRISAFNAPSLAAHARLGLVKCHSTTFLLFGPLQLALLPRPPFVHLSFSDRQRPTIQLRPPEHGSRSSMCRPMPGP